MAIVYRSIPQYRRRFYELLRDRLDDLGIELVLVYGQPGPDDAAKRDSIELPWAHKIRNKVIKLGPREVYWQPCLSLLRDVDLVIVEAASKLLVNYLLFAGHLLGVKRLAFWGHGKNFREQHRESSLSESAKRFMSRRVHWWFAYNDLSARVVTALGYPEARITPVQNAIDTRALTRAQTKVSTAHLHGLRDGLGLVGNNVCIYAGSMYAEKRLSFLLEACALVRDDIPDFEVIFVGAGPEDSIVKEAAEAHRWIHYVGPKFDEDKVPYFMLSKLLLIPASVGLAVLDAFALEVPLVTTDVPIQGPEIEYLVNDVNGVIVRDSLDPAAYATSVTRLLREEPLRQKLVNGCRKSKDLYTIERMAQRFATGILAALEVNKGGDSKAQRVPSS